MLYSKEDASLVNKIITLILDDSRERIEKLNSRVSLLSNSLDSLRSQHQSAVEGHKQMIAEKKAEIANLKDRIAEMERQNSGKLLISETELQNLCSKIADFVPVERYGISDPVPLKCFLTNPKNSHCCSSCPAARVCPCTRKIFSR